MRDLKYSDSLVGKSAKCPHCGNRVRLTGSASSAAKAVRVEPASLQRQLSPLEQVRATSGAVEPPAHHGLFVCGTGSAPDVLLLTQTHLILGAVHVSNISQLSEKLRTGSDHSSIMNHPSWSVALKDLKKVETGAGDSRGGYVKFWSSAPNGQQEKLVVFDKKTVGASFLNQLRAQLGDGWEESLCRDWELYRMDLGAGLGVIAFVTLIGIIALLAASGEGDWETDRRVGILKLIMVAILWVLGSLLGPIGTILLWLAIVGYVFYSVIYSGWRESLSILRISPRKT